jgi:Cof subfamily protein (haloacid dehalogenase superfamily)
MKGLIALDMDGTLTSHPNKIEDTLWQGLLKFSQMGWQFLFVTGRTHKGASSLLQNCPLINFYLSCYNGAYTLKYPEKSLKKQHFLSIDDFAIFNSAIQDHALDFVVYGGPLFEDIVYYRESEHMSHLQDYIKHRQLTFSEKWKILDNFESSLPPTKFPSVKMFASVEQLAPISLRLEKGHDLHAPIIKDPYFKKLNILQVTHKLANKGQAVNEIHNEFFPNLPCIAAGDDLNDISMLEYADISISFNNAHTTLKQQVDFIVPPPSELGLLEGLEKATQHMEKV